MKKYLLLIILFPIVGMGQSYSNPYTPPQQVNVTVKKDPNDFSTSFTQGMQAGASLNSCSFLFNKKQRFHVISIIDKNR